MQKFTVTQLRLAVVALSFLGFQLGAHADDGVYVQIPQADIQVPAIDLVHNGVDLGIQKAIALRASGVDLSTLDPKPNDLWQPTPMSMSANPADFPAEGSTMTFGTRAEASGFYKAKVTDARGISYSLVIDLNNHRSLATAALMRRIGYQVHLPQYYRSLKLKFASRTQYDDFMGADRTHPETSPAPGDVFLQTSKLPERWVTKADPANFEVTLQDVNLEPARITVPQYYQGSIDPGWIQGRRSARAAIVLLSLMNFHLKYDDINLFLWEAGRIENQNILLQHPNADVFRGTAIDDARWIIRRIAQFDRTEWKRILENLHFPSDIEAILLEKIIARRDHLVEMFGLKEELPSSLKALGFNTYLNIGSVRKGEVTKEIYPGYAARFSVGDPKSFLRWAELKHFVKIEAIAQAVGAGVAKMNEYLQFEVAKDGMLEHIKGVYKDAFEFQVKHPGEAYVVPVKTWTKPLFGLIANANRSVVTGTYYGSESKVQLVDNLAVGISYGRFGGIDGKSWAYDKDTFNYKFLGQASVGIVRNYTHVRPLPTLAAEGKESWAHLAVPLFMRSLGKIVDDDIVRKGDVAVKAALKVLLDDLREGEVFTITDSATLRGGPNYTIPLTALMGPGLAAIGPSVGFGLMGEFVIMKRLMITRRNGNIEIYETKMNTRGWSPSMDLNAWINVARASYQQKSGNAKTDAMMLDTSSIEPEAFPEGEVLSDAQKEVAQQRKNLLKTLHALFRHNDLEPIRKHAPPWQIEHEMKSKLLSGKVLMWSWQSFSNRHKLRLMPPPPPPGTPEDKMYDPKKNVRTLYQVRRVDLQGKDPYGFFGQVASRASKVAGVFEQGGSLNPSNSFMGKASWTAVKTEADITSGTDYEPVITVEDHYAGWNIKREQLLKILTSIENEMKVLNQKFTLFRPAVFSSTEKLQAYEIHSSILIFPEGVQRLERALFDSRNRQERLIRLMDMSETPDLRGRCRDYLAHRGLESELEILENLPEDSKLWNSCIEPWMRKVMRWVKKAPSRDKKEEFVEWMNRTVHFMQRKASLPKMLKRIGPDQFFFRVQVNGFRTGDANGDESYIPDTIGSIPENAKFSPFHRISVFNGDKEWTLLEFETNAQYLGGSGL